MTRRLKALFMLLIFGLVLPAAGAPQLFCTRAQSFVRQDCCCAKTHCGDCPDDRSPLKPSCFSAVKVFPDGVNPEQVVLPALAALPMPPFALPEPREILLLPLVSGSPRDRAPPDGFPPLYLSQRSLLL